MRRKASLFGQRPITVPCKTCQCSGQVNRYTFNEPYPSFQARHEKLPRFYWDHKDTPEPCPDCKGEGKRIATKADQRSRTYGR